MYVLFIIHIIVNDMPFSSYEVALNSNLIERKGKYIKEYFSWYKHTGNSHITNNHPLMCINAFLHLQKKTYIRIETKVSETKPCTYKIDICKI